MNNVPITHHSPALVAHILSLLVSAVFFFISFGVIGYNPSPSANIAKIVLWYSALTIELVTHFIPPLLGLRGHVRYPAEGLYSRASVLFLIVLGQGKLGGFRFQVSVFVPTLMQSPWIRP